MKDQLDFNRIGYLLVGDLLNRYRSIGITSGVIAGILIVQAILFRSTPENQQVIYWILTGSVLFLWAPAISAQSFIELHDKTRNDAYLLLPASALEKVLARLILGTVIFPVYALVFVTVVAWVTSGLKTLLVGVSEPLFLPFTALNRQSIGFFVVNQATFFLGAAWFRKQHFMKTALAMTVVTIGIFLFAMVVVRIVFPDFAELNELSIQIDPTQVMGFFRRFSDGLAILAGVLFYGVVPLFCWLVAWMRVKETQVSYGI